MLSLKKRLEDTPTLLGTFAALGSVEAVELACHAGFDFVIVDAQHGVFDNGGLREVLRAIQVTGCFPIIRPPAYGLSTVESFLDMGYPAMLAPMVNTPEQAAELVTATHYPPTGTRSQSSCRASLCYPDYRKSFNEDFSLLVMIEHIRAVENIEAIVAQPGVAGCFLGMTDLVSSMTEPTDTAPIIERVRSVVSAAGKIAGIAASSMQVAQRYRAQGFQIIALGTDRRLLTSAMNDTVKAWQGGE